MAVTSLARRPDAARSLLPATTALTRRSALAAALLAGLAACDRQPAGASPRLRGIDLTGAPYAQDFALPDADGRPRRLADFRGKVVIVFFGYTHCPDVCPTTMAEVAQVQAALGPQGDRVQGIFITVDPERDTPVLLKAYVEGFDPRFIALRGTPEQTKALAQQFKVHYQRVPGKTPESYTIDHTAASFVFDPQGRIRVYARYGQGAEPLLADVQTLLAGA